MPRARALAVAVLLLSYGAVGARQPAVRAALPLPVPATRRSPRQPAFPLPIRPRSSCTSSASPSVLKPGPHRRTARGARPFAKALRTPDGKTSDTVPLPLDPGIWRETILQQPVPDSQLVAAILADRRAALLYHGLAGLDDETLAWLGPDRETLLQRAPAGGAFATFGRSIHVRGGRVLVPADRTRSRCGRR